MHRPLIAATLLAAAILVDTTAAAPPDPGPPPHALGFLEPGKDYVIRFPEASNIFKTTQSAVTESTYTTADGQTKSNGPVTWNFTLSVEVFQVVRFGDGSWVLLRHPTRSDDVTRWSEQRRAQAILAGPHAKAIGARPDGRERLRKLRDAAGAEVPTSETWVNLDHAIAIAAVPTEDIERKLTIKSIQTRPKE